MRRTLNDTTRGMVVLLMIVAGCARAPLRGPENAMRRVKPPEISELIDDLPMQSLMSAVEEELRFFESKPPASAFVFGDQVYTPDEYLRGLRRLLELGKSASDRTVFLTAVRNEFDFFEVYGQKSWGEAFVTSYYEPLLEGSRRPTQRFDQPIYATPDDLVSLDLGLFDSKYQHDRKLRGRLRGKEVLPYYSREEIDSKYALKGRGLEICYVDPLDAFFLQVQGSGIIRLDDGKEIKVNYAEKNGQVYEGISKFLRPYIPADQLNLHTVEAYLRKLPRQEMRSLLNRNPSYVFFRVSPVSATTYLGVSATDGRTIATDQRYFPKGALAFVLFEKPVFDSAEAPVPVKSEKTGRFVLDQDVGGAITGGGRLDLFWGRGAEAKRYAGAMKTMGRLYYLAPKKAGSNP